MTTNNKTIITSGTMLALSIMLVAGLSFASAHGGEDGEKKYRHTNPEKHLEAKAAFFEMTPEALKERLDAGETYRDIAESLGITKEEMTARIKEKV